VLSTPANASFADAFVPARQRALAHHHFVDLPYPACWRRREHGIDRTRLNEYFGHIL
jgi:hypothetical protein